MTRLQDFPQAKIITCILPDEGQDMMLLKALRTEKGIVSANTFQCRGFGLQLRSRYKGKTPGRWLFGAGGHGRGRGRPGGRII